MENLYLIVGLGNPGQDYANTRHNAGFQVTDLLAKRWRAPWSQERKFNARLARAQRHGRQIILCQPQTFMNASGEAAGAVRAYYQIEPSRMLVVVDDADLPLGELRLRPGGGNGGHHGLESISQHLGTKEYARQRVGIGRAPDGRRDIVNHVLGSFSAGERGLLEHVLERAADQAEAWVGQGLQKAMNRFNGMAAMEETTQ